MAKASGLESVLRWRRSLERAAEQALKKAVGEVHQAKGELRAISAERRALGAGLRERLREGASSEVFQLYSPAALVGMEESAGEKMRAAEAERARAERRYAECRRDRKVIKNMLDRREVEDRMEASRREQVRVDEATMQRVVKQAADPSIGRSN